MLRVNVFVTGMVQTNVYFIVNEETKHCIMVDPADNAGQLSQILEERLQVTLDAVLLTHGHFDHILAVPELIAKYQVPLYAAEAERPLLTKQQIHPFTGGGIDLRMPEFIPLHDGDTLHLLDTDWQVLSTPGHTKGSVCYFHPKGEGEKYNLLISGDTLFAESFGRTDLPGGSSEEIFHSIRDRLLTLPPDTLVYPGHEEMTSIDHERKYNPIARVQGSDELGEPM